MEKVNKMINKLFIDVGVGDITSKKKEAWDIGTDFSIIGFEPSLNRFNNIKDTYPGKLFNLAVSDKDGELECWEHPEQGVNCYLRENSNNHFKKVKKKAIKLDSLKWMDFEEIHIWADTEGAELLILKGATEMLSSGKVKWINLEVRKNPPGEGWATASQVYEFLDKYRFRPGVQLTQLRETKHCDVVFVPKVKLHIYGKYMGDLKIIHDVLEESNEYDLSYEYFDTGEGDRPANIDYIISSHRNPTWFRGNVIHAQHGLGCLPKLHNLDKRPDLPSLYKRRYSAICTYGKIHKSWFAELGFPDEKLLIIGMPASIELLSPVNAKEREGFLHTRGLDANKKIIIYAPTWDQREERGFFCLWWRDGKEEERVERFCKYITGELGMNLIVRLHEKGRYSQDWIGKYRRIFNAYNVWARYLSEDPYNLTYFKYSDVLVGDLSNVNTYFYVMDKPVIHIGINPFKKKFQRKWGGMALNDRAGYIIEDFNDLLIKIKASVENPSQFSAQRKKTVDKYIDYLGEDSKKAILSEFKRLLQ